MLSTLLRRTLLVLAGNGFSKLLLLLFEFLLVTKIGAAGYGLYSICAALLLVVSNLALLGTDFGIVQHLAIYQEQKREDKVQSLLVWCLVVIGAVGLLTGALIAFSAPFLAQRVFAKPELAYPILLVSLAIPFETINQATSAMFRGFRSYKEHIFVSDLARNVSLMLCLPLVTILHWRLEHILLFSLGGSVTATCFGMMRLSKRLKGASLRLLRDRTVFKEVFGFSYSLFIWNVFQKIAGRSQMLLAGMFLSSHDVGIFGVFMRMILLFTFLQTGINMTAPVEFARLNHLGEHKKLNDLLQITAKTLFIACILLAMPLVVDPKTLMAYFGKGFETYAWLLVPLTVAQVVNVGTGPIGQLLIACRKQNSLFIVSLLGVSVQIILSVLLMPRFGLPGAVMAETATNLTLTAAKHVFSFRALRIHAFTKEFVLLSAGGIVSAMIGWRIAEAMPGRFGYFSGVTMALICCAFLLALYSSWDRQFKSQVRVILSRKRS